ncbi:hypothetical protein [Lacihabitans sp. CS3-21]|uniref:hypothetical protein n=1 Tax=Lacihabitans sp. CS3-21 TaxID=2487332 RepID=UPI0020CC6473|nr:hypothetical protein [Lacihabitans sp. CS3-21]MCP9746329.1 hypothetical protein [Lacihabitans sp. CS3-21]
MEKWILKNEVDYLANINSYGKTFFDKQEYLRNIESALNISFDQKKDFTDYIHIIQEELCTKSLLLNEPNRQRELTKKMETDLLHYLISYDLAKHAQYKMKVYHGLIVDGEKFCPVLLNKDGEIILGTIKFLFYNMSNLITKDFWEIPLTYTNPKKRKSINYDVFYEVYENIKIMKL